jgi:hypothetical protein
VEQEMVVLETYREQVVALEGSHSVQVAELMGSHLEKVAQSNQAAFSQPKQKYFGVPSF